MAAASHFGNANGNAVRLPLASKIRRVSSVINESLSKPNVNECGTAVGRRTSKPRRLRVYSEPP
jgi:hypothetical protein